MEPTISENLRARALELTDDQLVVDLYDGSRHSAPIALFPILAEATFDERAHWELIGSGSGIHWPEIDEHISVLSIVHPEKTVPMRSEATAGHILGNRERRARRTT